MKIGLIIANYNCVEYAERFFQPWLEYKKDNDLLISVVDGRFVGFGGETQNSNDGGLEFLQKYSQEGKIDFFTQLAKDVTEHDARNVALNPLLELGCDCIIISAFDEIFSLQNIENIFKYVEKEKFINLFRINYKNYTFSDSTYTLGFSPKRIWRIDAGDYIADKFTWDDDMQYFGKITRDIIPDNRLSTKTIPNELVAHYTWLSDERSKQKCEYQEKHFGHGAGCSFKWNYETDKLEFNEDFFIKTGQAKPEILKEKE